MKWRLKQQKINKTKNWFLEKINKIDKPLVTQTKRNKENTQINNKNRIQIQSKKGDITTDKIEIQKTIREYFENLYSKVEPRGYKQTKRIYNEQ
jgi:hypothetical protein